MPLATQQLTRINPPQRGEELCEILGAWGAPTVYPVVEVHRRDSYLFREFDLAHSRPLQHSLQAMR